MSYAWIIDQDHLADPEDEPGTNMNAVGVCGPRDAPDELIELLEIHATKELAARHADAEIYRFRMYDDDGELYYTGRMITDEGATEEASFGPLDDYGTPNAGCTLIKYQGHPDMDCG